MRIGKTPEEKPGGDTLPVTSSCLDGGMLIAMHVPMVKERAKAFDADVNVQSTTSDVGSGVATKASTPAGSSPACIGCSPDVDGKLAE